MESPDPAVHAEHTPNTGPGVQDGQLVEDILYLVRRACRFGHDRQARTLYRPSKLADADSCALSQIHLASRLFQSGLNFDYIRTSGEGRRSTMAQASPFLGNES